jgi:hypothetical protein
MRGQPALPGSSRPLDIHPFFNVGGDITFKVLAGRGENAA